MSLPDSLRCPEAEADCLGAAMSGDALSVLFAHVTPQDFGEPDFRTLATALASLAGEEVIPDSTLIAERYARLRLGPVPPTLYERVLAGSSTAALIPHYAAIVRDRSSRRAAYLALEAAAQQAADLHVPLSETAAAAATALTANATLEPQPTIRQLVLGALEIIEHEGKDGVMPGIPFGLRRVDDLTRGWQPGTLTLVAARPSVGKTQFALFAAREACSGELPVLFVTAEMSALRLTRRLVAIHAGVDLARELHGSDWSAMARAAGEIAQWPLQIDSRAQTAGMVRLAADRMRRDYGSLGLVVVDYVQLLRGDGRAENRNLEVGRIGRALHRLSLDFAVPVIALSQLSRAVEKGKEPRRPVLSDLRDSGELEQSADLVAFLHADEKEDDVIRDIRRVEFILAKNRDGRKGKTDLEVHGSGRWQEVSWEHRKSA